MNGEGEGDGEEKSSIKGIEGMLKKLKGVALDRRGSKALITLFMMLQALFSCREGERQRRGTIFIGIDTSMLFQKENQMSCKTYKVHQLTHSE